MFDTTEKPELIAKLSVGRTTSGECSLCHEAIVVKGAATDAPEQVSDLLTQLFAEHVFSKHTK